MKKRESVWTSDLREAYEFARYVDLKDDAEDVEVEHGSDGWYYIRFTIFDSLQARKEIMDIAREFDFLGLNFPGAWK